MNEFSWDKALNLASSLASLAFETMTQGVRSLASLTDLRPGMIIAAVAGGLVFILALRVFLAVK